MAVLEESRGHRTDPAFPDAQRCQRALVKEPVDFGNGHIKQLGNIGQGQPVAYKGFNSTHGTRLPRRAPASLVETAHIRSYGIFARDTPNRRDFPAEIQFLCYAENRERFT